MQVIAIATGMLGENAYIAFRDGAREALVIDPGDDAEKIIETLDQRGLVPTDILLTHGHHDHIGAVRKLKEKYGAKVAVHHSDADMLTDPKRNLSPIFMKKTAAEPADCLLSDGDAFTAAGLPVAVLHTPGHSAGSVCFLIEDSLFSGDTLFEGTVGRTDFPDSSWEEMERSLARLNALPGNYKVFPGHGPATTLEDERKYNPWMKG